MNSNFLTINVKNPKAFIEGFNTTPEDVLASEIPLSNDVNEEEECHLSYFPLIDTKGYTCIDLCCKDCPFYSKESARAWIKLAIE